MLTDALFLEALEAQVRRILQQPLHKCRIIVEIVYAVIDDERIGIAVAVGMPSTSKAATWPPKLCPIAYKGKFGLRSPAVQIKESKSFSTIHEIGFYAAHRTLQRFAYASVIKGPNLKALLG